MQDDKIDAVKNWPVPRTISELRSFLGICGYYIRFVDGFAIIAAPLYKLQKKGVAFEWTIDQQNAFVRLKDAVISAPILEVPRDEGTYLLDTDASDTGLGAVLSQEHHGTEKVLAYASRVLSSPEKNYDVTRKELLAVVYGLKQLKQYLMGRRFIIRTDHTALQWLRKTPRTHGPMVQVGHLHRIFRL